MPLVASALAGGDCTDDADVLRTVRTAGTLNCMVKTPSTLGNFLRSFRWGHVRQLDQVSRELLAQSRAAGAVRQRLGAASGGNKALLRRRPPPTNGAADFLIQAVHDFAIWTLYKS